MTVFRFELPAHGHVSQVPLQAGLHWSWVARTRILTIQNYGEIDRRRIPEKFDAVAVTYRKGKIRSVDKQRLPESAIAAAMWAFGFLRKHRAPTLDEVLAAVIVAQKAGNHDPIVVCDGIKGPEGAASFLAVYVRHDEYNPIPFRWAATESADPHAIRRALLDESNRIVKY